MDTLSQINSKYLPDRRQHNLSVVVDRRSGVDRRKVQRSSNLQVNKDTYAAVLRQTYPDATPLSAIPPMDQVENIQDSVEKKHYYRAVGAAILLVNSFRKDIMHLKKIKDETVDSFRNKGLMEEAYQERFLFLQGTEIDKIKLKLLKFIDDIDVTLFDTKIGKYILKKLGMKDYDEIKTEAFDKFGAPIYKTKILGNKFVEVLGRAFLRTPVLGILALSLLEMPGIIKSKNHKKRAVKATINVTSITAGGAILGAIGAYYPPFGFIGAGVGAYLGYKLAEKINNNI